MAVRYSTQPPKAVVTDADFEFGFDFELSIDVTTLNVSNFGGDITASVFTPNTGSAKIVTVTARGVQVGEGRKITTVLTGVELDIGAITLGATRPSSPAADRAVFVDNDGAGKGNVSMAKGTGGSDWVDLGNLDDLVTEIDGISSKDITSGTSVPNSGSPPDTGSIFIETDTGSVYLYSQDRDGENDDDITAGWGDPVWNLNRALQGRAATESDEMSILTSPIFSMQAGTTREFDVSTLFRSPIEGYKWNRKARLNAAIAVNAFNSFERVSVGVSLPPTAEVGDLFIFIDDALDVVNYYVSGTLTDSASAWDIAQYDAEGTLTFSHINDSELETALSHTAANAVTFTNGKLKITNPDEDDSGDYVIGIRASNTEGNITTYQVLRILSSKPQLL